MIVKGLGPDYDVVEVDVADVPDEWAEGGEHAALVCGGGVAATLRHHRPFVQAEGGGDRRVLNVIRVHMRLKERVSHVKLTPDAPLRTIGEDLLHTRKGVDVRDGVLVQNTVVVDPSGKSRGISFGN